MHLLLEVVHISWKRYEEVKRGLSCNSGAGSVVGLFFLITACSDCSFNQLMLLQVPFLLYFNASGMIYICTVQ